MEFEGNKDFDELMVSKDKRRVSRSKGNRTYEKTKISKHKPLQKKTKNIPYNPEMDYSDYEI